MTEGAHAAVNENEKGELRWSGLTYTVAVPEEGGCRGGEATEKAVLSGVSGFADPGQLLAIMGPSGSGKTSLLNALAGRVPLEEGAALAGTVRLGGEPVPDMARVSAYVMQDEALFALSTVRETLMFHARLRVAGAAPEELAVRVDEVIGALGLVECQHTVVGGFTTGQGVGGARGLSGGERRRVAIAVEMLSRPAIVFCDEPTSGLDAFQAQKVMEILSALARRGQTVIVSIHQPRSSIWQLVDSVLLLSMGKVAYFGSAGATACGWFAAAGHPVEQHYNPADHFLDTVAVDYTSDGAILASKARVAALQDRFARTASSVSPKRSSAVHSLADTPAAAAPRPLARAPLAVAFPLLFRRCWREQTRDLTGLGFKHGCNLFFYVVLSIIFARMDFNQTSIQNRTGLLFFMAMNLAFSSIIGTAQVIPMQLRVVNRERSAGLYGVAPYFFSVFMTMLPLELLPQLLNIAVVYFLTNLRNGAVPFFTCVAILVLENFVGIALGVLLSALISNPAMVPQIAPAVCIIFLLFGGYFLNDDMVPVYLDWFKYLSYIRYAFQALCVNEFKGMHYENDAGYNQTFTGDEWLERLSFKNTSVVLSCVWNLTIFGAANALGLAALVLKRPQYQPLEDAPAHAVGMKSAAPFA